MCDSRKVVPVKSEKIVEKMFLRIFVILLAAILFTSWFLVGLNKVNFMYAIWISLGVLVGWVIIMIIYTISDRKLNPKRSGKPYKSKEMGVLSAIPKEYDDNEPENQ